MFFFCHSGEAKFAQPIYHEPTSYHSNTEVYENKQLKKRENSYENVNKYEPELKSVQKLNEPLLKPGPPYLENFNNPENTYNPESSYNSEIFYDEPIDESGNENYESENLYEEIFESKNSYQEQPHSDEPIYQINAPEKDDNMANKVFYYMKSPKISTYADGQQSYRPKPSNHERNIISQIGEKWLTESTTTQKPIYKPKKPKRHSFKKLKKMFGEKILNGNSKYSEPKSYNNNNNPKGEKHALTDRS